MAERREVRALVFGKREGRRNWDAGCANTSMIGIEGKGREWPHSNVEKKKVTYYSIVISSR